ncbi:PQQ-binding-like beta-propeller repeat protein [Pleionea sediminis]|uniref:outer membrane protein assembly factor BamB family protein n=1 Tax=Pleionea sediminis TaxID=2569479 RepID=UPI0011847016|nr:PQQ-binding-like beta-propeller repeat protein [Pleionea sediminis]
MNRIFLGMRGVAICIDKKSGEIVWKTKLKSGSSVTNVTVDGDDVIVYSGGHLFCLDIDSGTEKWSNSLKGMGYGHCIIASENSASAVAAAQSSQAAAASVAASTAAIAGSS